MRIPERSIQSLPTPSCAPVPSSADRFRRATASEFLDSMHCCFENEEEE